jgi:hypothetical protein
MSHQLTATPPSGAHRATGLPLCDERDGDPIAEVEDIALDLPSGRVAYAIVGFGGILGLGRRHCAVPWDLLSYDGDMGALAAPFGADTLAMAPPIEAVEEGGHIPEAQRGDIDSYFRMFRTRPT